MKCFLLLFWLFFSVCIEAQIMDASFPKHFTAEMGSLEVESTDGQSNDYSNPKHFAAGMVVGGLTSFFIYKKSNNKLKSWAIGVGASVVAGIAKEAIDSARGNEFSGEEIGYTVLGGAIGSSIVFPLKKRKPKEIAYLF